MTRVELRSGVEVVLSHGLAGLFQVNRHDEADDWCVQTEPSRSETARRREVHSPGILTPSLC